MSTSAVISNLGNVYLIIYKIDDVDITKFSYIAGEDAEEVEQKIRDFVLESQNKSIAIEQVLCVAKRLWG